jgi:hypothetical protein
MQRVRLPRPGFAQLEPQQARFAPAAGQRSLSSVDAGNKVGRAPLAESGVLAEEGAMSLRHVRILFAGCAAVCTATLGVSTALASTTWTVQPGGAFRARSGTATFKDTMTGNTFTCRSLSATGTLKSGSGLAGSDAGSLSAVGFRTCSEPLGPGLTLQATDLPWHENFLSYHGGVVTGTIGHLRIALLGPSCNAVLDGISATASDGLVKFRYTDSTGRLTVLTGGGTPHFYDVSGCAGLFTSGDPATISATFTLNPKQAITSPSPAPGTRQPDGSRIPLASHHGGYGCLVRH